MDASRRKVSNFFLNRSTIVSDNSIGTCPPRKRAADCDVWSKFAVNEALESDGIDPGSIRSGSASEPVEVDIETEDANSVIVATEAEDDD